MKEKVAQKLRFKRGYGVYVWLAALLAFFLLFQLCKNNMSVMDFFTRYITAPYKQFVGSIMAVLPFSVAEWLCCALVIGCITYVIITIKRIIAAKGHRAEKVFHFALTALCIPLTVYAGFTALWGANYYTQSFESRSGLVAAPVSVQQLYDTTALFAQMANDAAAKTARDENGLFAGKQDEIFAKSKTLYRPLEEEYPFLKGAELGAKPMLLSEVMSIMNYTGFYFPFTGESNINIYEPAAFMPSTIAHEIAHQRGIAPEQTANFLSVRACALSQDVNYQYSGYLLGYVHLSNALYAADYSLWSNVAQSLSPLVVADLEHNRQYWQKYESPVADAVDATYSEFLKSYDQELGSKSYGAVVDLLVAYYA